LTFPRYTSAITVQRRTVRANSSAHPSHPAFSAPTVSPVKLAQDRTSPAASLRSDRLVLIDAGSDLAHVFKLELAHELLEEVDDRLAVL